MLLTVAAVSSVSHADSGPVCELGAVGKCWCLTPLAQELWNQDRPGLAVSTVTSGDIYIYLDIAVKGRLIKRANIHHLIGYTSRVIA